VQKILFWKSDENARHSGGDAPVHGQKKFSEFCGHLREVVLLRATLYACLCCNTAGTEACVAFLR
jgi:hypothetical protein